MASQNFIPKDEDDRERVRFLRDKFITEKLLQAFTRQLALDIDKMVKDSCPGCTVNHCSQTRHPCLWYEPDEKILMYFDTAFENISEAEVIKHFMNNLPCLKPGLNGLELIQYLSDDNLKRFCMGYRMCMKRDTFVLLCSSA